ncbi:MAG TPA: DegT/DnrJ/EryC1/StrS family aminotransferase [Pyrinomonadaceae bacterium]|nr:DegT/DnrJ/EryC1/StrS family aminotransferase [Pyrinomonadaceae bacterium]
MTTIKWKVPLLDLGPQHRALRAELRAAVERVLDSQRFVLGPEVEALEREVAQYSQTRFAVGCASGSDALLLALMALDIKAGDEVITTPFSFFATAGAIARLGARPVFADIDPRTYTLDVSRAEAAVTARTRAIIPVHLYGQCADMDALLDLSRVKGLSLVEDAAQAIGAKMGGRCAGSMGLVGCLSFYPSKNLGGAGDGGMLLTSDEDLRDRLRRLRVHGGASEYHHDEVGINSRLDALQAAVLRVKLRLLEHWSEGRRKRAARYTNFFREADLGFELSPPFTPPDTLHIFHQYVIRVPGYRDALMKHLLQSGIESRVYYPVPLHLQPCFKYLGCERGAFPEAERAALETLALPCYPELTDEQQEYVLARVGSFRP